MTDKEYDMHWDRVRNMLVISGEYDNESEWMLDTDTRLILSAPEQNPEYFTL